MKWNVIYSSIASSYLPVAIASEFSYLWTHLLNNPCKNYSCFRKQHPGILKFKHLRNSLTQNPRGLWVLPSMINKVWWLTTRISGCSDIHVKWYQRMKLVIVPRKHIPWDPIQHTWFLSSFFLNEQGLKSLYCKMQQIWSFKCDSDFSYKFLLRFWNVKFLHWTNL